MGKSTINEIFLQKMNEDAGIIWDLQELWFHLLVNCMMLHGIDQQSRGLLNDYHRQAKESEPISPVKTESCPWQM
jgi:phosphoribosyl-ATP pyrophosphohydrolase